MKTATVRRGVALAMLLWLSAALSGCGAMLGGSQASFTLEEVPAFAGEPYVVLEENVPSFGEEDMTTNSYETYSPHDLLGRCGPAEACVGQDLMPTEERGEIGMVKPAGWHTVKYDCVDGTYLYNRCHLLGYQLTGENANEENLITGTRYMNVDGMLPFENQVADYVQETGNHVLYRVTPIYQGAELLARGVQMEALSVEDNGAGVRFNVYVYNAQPGVEIDYATGNSALASDGLPEQGEVTYVLNTASHKFHRPDCSGVSTMAEKNRQETGEDRQTLLDKGYQPCGQCKP